MMSLHLSPVFILQRWGTLRFLGRGIPLSWFFRWAELSVFLGVLFLPHERKVLRTVLEGVSGKDPKNRTRGIGRKQLRRHIVYRKWLKYLLYAWPNWMDRCEEWSTLDGKEHLDRVLMEQKGAVLLCGHRFGYERFVAPILAMKGYKIKRTGRGSAGAERVTRWGHPAHLPWGYINYGNDYWTHLRALKQMRQALAEKQIVHLSIRMERRGPPDSQIELFGGKYSLDPALLEVIEMLQAPVLPCFCLSTERGELRIEIYPVVKPSRRDIMASFAPLYTRYLHAFPEYSQIWKRLALGWEAL
jgi:lauroyl/myristoyl acyltransferase